MNDIKQEKYYAIIYRIDKHKFLNSSKIMNPPSNKSEAYESKEGVKAETQ